jgi:LPXTG-motif cell wall-anchored protein
VFIFQISSTLITASNSDVTFINGASPCNVYWQVGSSATLGTGTDFVGTILAQASITMDTGADLEGRALAQTAAVTLDDNVITTPICAAAPTTGPAPTGTATAGPTTAAPTGAATTGVPVPDDSTSGGPELPRTGQNATVPVLAAAGVLLVAAGIGILVRVRRRPLTP